jgi:hypothetical protein
MKTRKQLLGLIAIAIIALAIIGCKEDEPDPPPPQEQPISYVTIGGKTIPVYKTAGVSDADFTTTVTNTQSAFDDVTGLGTPALNYFKANVTKIEIGGTGITFNAGVLKIQGGLTNAKAIAGNLGDIYADTLV